jgi:hypothetical protein
LLFLEDLLYFVKKHEEEAVCSYQESLE